MELTNVIACVNSSDSEVYLVPYRLSLPSFLPKNQTAAKRMLNDLLEDYITEAWLIDEKEESDEDDPDPNLVNHNQIKSVLRQGVDWESCSVLEYDFEQLDGYGGLENDPFDIWEDVWASRKNRDHQPGLISYLKDEQAEAYAKYLSREAWASWSLEDLMRNPCWMFYYAKNVCKGRLPDVLDNCMTFQDSENPWVKKYFGTKRYRSRNRKALASTPWAA